MNGFAVSARALSPNSALAQFLMKQLKWQNQPLMFTVHYASVNALSACWSPAWADKQAAHYQFLGKAIPDTGIHRSAPVW